jgi:hypothetical protein
MGWFHTNGFGDPVTTVFAPTLAAAIVTTDTPTSMFVPRTSGTPKRRRVRNALRLDAAGAYRGAGSRVDLHISSKPSERLLSRRRSMSSVTWNLAGKVVSH